MATRFSASAGRGDETHRPAGAPAADAGAPPSGGARRRPGELPAASSPRPGRSPSWSWPPWTTARSAPGLPSWRRSSPVAPSSAGSATPPRPAPLPSSAPTYDDGSCAILRDGGAGRSTGELAGLATRGRRRPSPTSSATSRPWCWPGCCSLDPGGDRDPRPDQRVDRLATLPLIPVFGILVGLATQDRARSQWRDGVAVRPTSST